jgi:hypothetical protein
VSIRAILDTSAIRPYAAGSIAVGELIGEFSDEGARFGLPVLCLIEAAAGADPRTLAMLGLLTHHTEAVLLPVATEQWQQAAAAASLYGTTARACAVLPVIDGSADYVMTAEPDSSPGIDTIVI